MRPHNFEDRFDCETVFFDVFWDAAYETVIFTAAPFLNLDDDLGLTVRAMPSGTLCQLDYDPNPHFARYRTVPPKGTVGFEIDSRAGRVVLPIQPSLARVFEGRKAIYTLQKDNDLLWIRDWAYFYAKEHGADAAIIYDNGSTRYSCAEVANVLDAVPGIEEVAVVDWPFPYGAFDLRETLSFNLIDSIYCQFAGFDHVFRRLAPTAAGLVNVDLDELMVRRGARTIFDAAEESPTGCVRVFGYWCENTRSPEDAALPQRRHRQFTYLQHPEPRVCEAKWGIAPQKVSDNIIFEVHRFLNSYSPFAADMTLFHFRGINTMWDHDRALFDPRAVEHVASEDNHRQHPLLAEAMARVFDGDDGETLPQRAPARADMAGHIARVKAGRAAAAGDTDRAIALTREAIAQDGTVQSYYEFLAQCLDKAGGQQADAQAARGEAAKVREADFGFHYQAGARKLILESPSAAKEHYEKSMLMAPEEPAPLRRWVLCMREDKEFETLVKLAPEAIKRAPDAIMAGFLYQAFHEHELVDEAHQMLLDAIELSPRDPGLYGILATSHIRARRFLEAREAIQTAFRLASPRYVAEHNAKIQEDGMSMFEFREWSEDLGRLDEVALAIAEALGYHDDALKHAQRAAARSNKMSVQRKAAAVMDAAGDHAGAAAARERIKAIVAQPEITKPILDAGWWSVERWRMWHAANQVIHQIDEGRIEEAEAILQENRENDLVDELILFEATRQFRLAGASDAAMRTGELALQEAPRDNDIRVLLARIVLDRGDAEGALLVIDGAEEDDRSSTTLLLMRATVLRVLGRDGEVVQVLRQALQRDAKLTGAQTMLFNVLLKAGQSEAALEAAQAAIAANPSVADHHKDAGRALSEAGDLDGAVRCYDQALELSPRDADVLVLKARAQMKRGDGSAALKTARTAVKFAPNNALAHLLVGQALVKAGLAENAVPPFKRYMGLVDDPAPWALSAYARALLKNKRFDEALSAVEQAIAKGDSQAHAVKERILTAKARAQGEPAQAK